MSRAEAREHSFRIIFASEFHPERPIEQVMEDYLEYFPEGEISDKDLSFIRKEVTGTMAHLAEIDPMISSELIGWTLERISRTDRAILRLALYEIKFTEESYIPASVSINEAVELAKRYSQAASSGFVNGVLANFAEKTDRKAGSAASGEKTDEA